MYSNEYRLMIVDVNAIVECIDANSIIINQEYKNKVEEWKTQGKVVCAISQGYLEDFEMKAATLRKMGIFADILDNSEYGDLFELNEIIQHAAKRYHMDLNEVLFITNNKLNKYLSLSVLAVNWDEIL